MCGRVIQSSGPLRLAIVEGLDVSDSRLGPPAPKDFGPHFDFPAHSLNSGPTEAPYPGW